jgi:hypothetical protein
MFGKITKFDIWFLDNVVEPVSWRLEWWTGLSCFQQARMTLAVYIGSVYASCMIFDYRPFGLGISAMLVFYLYIRSMQAERHSGTSANPERYHSVFSRLFWWTILSIFVPTHSLLGWRMDGFALTLSDVSILCFMYLIACSAPPPRPKTMFADKLAPAMTGA